MLTRRHCKSPSPYRSCRNRWRGCCCFRCHVVAAVPGRTAHECAVRTVPSPDRCAARHAAQLPLATIPFNIITHFNITMQRLSMLCLVPVPATDAMWRRLCRCRVVPTAPPWSAGAMLPPWYAEPCSAEGRPAAWLPARKAAARLPHSKARGTAVARGSTTHHVGGACAVHNQ